MLNLEFHEYEIENCSTEFHMLAGYIYEAIDSLTNLTSYCVLRVFAKGRRHAFGGQSICSPLLKL